MTEYSDARISQVLQFWFEELHTRQWLENDEAIDQSIAERFSGLHAELSANVPMAWRASTEGSLAAIVVLDQFSRNLYRQDPRAFACDAIAHAMATEAIEKGWDQRFDHHQRIFFYLPFVHAENPEAQARAVELFAPLEADLFVLAKQHKVIIDRFGRFPHRNVILGRPSTKQELEFLQQPNSSF